jgi:hypothetical protein
MILALDVLLPDDKSSKITKLLIETKNCEFIWSANPSSSPGPSGPHSGAARAWGRGWVRTVVYYLELQKDVTDLKTSLYYIKRCTKECSWTAYVINTITILLRSAKILYILKYIKCLQCKFREKAVYWIVRNLGTYTVNQTWSYRGLILDRL